jgi:hypothetical protein
MMTKFLTLAVCLTLSSGAFARGENSGYWGKKSNRDKKDERGRDDNSSSSSTDLVTRGSQAWFAYETAEKEIRVLLADRKITQESVTSVDVTILTPSTSEIVLSSAGAQISDSCRMEDHSSHSGTIIKKEVYCDNAPYYSPEVRTTRGTNAWALHEAIEHSLNVEVKNNPASLETVVGASAEILNARSVKTIISLQGGVEKTYLCNNQGRSLNCFIQ